ncbi:EI24 domain-containing protein [Szabonella alba]|uniref:EI24 domain-containing protein n=1 Tax=Szabonella alba TaxID=2804194 RepID=A0A8K0V9P7_9RHOB|nr:EI24 domain-containing protein [Szabonella alba]
MFLDFRRALAQIGDPAFRRVLLLGIALALALLVAVYAAFLAVIQSFTPDSIEIPLVGPVGGLDTLLSWGSALFMLGLSVFLMMPVASAFTSLFLDDVAEAVEARHYPDLPPVPRLPFMDALVDSLNFVGLLIAVNVLALILYAFAGPFIPVVFWAVNGLLLGREYFTLVAMRRLGRQGAKAMRQRHWVAVWIAGTLMAAPLSIPLLNLLIPVLGAATFTHMFHRLHRAEGATDLSGRV